MTTKKIYRNKKNENKFIEVRLLEDYELVTA